MAGRFIKLYEKMLSWEWYHDINTFRLFIHLLLKANYKDTNWKGIVILRGQLVTSLPSLASQTGLTTRQVRVSLDKLKMTGEVADKVTNRYRLITIVKYDEYQSDGRQNGSQMADKTAGKRQADDRQMTASIDNIEYIEDVEKIEQIERERKTAKRFTPPTRDEIEIFCLENGLTIDIDRFINYYTANGWMVGRNRMKDWQATVRNWASGNNRPQRKPEPVKKVSAGDFEQRDYSDVPDEMLSSLAAEIEKARKDGII